MIEERLDIMERDLDLKLPLDNDELMDELVEKNNITSLKEFLKGLLDDKFSLILNIKKKKKKKTPVTVTEKRIRKGKDRLKIIPTELDKKVKELESSFNIQKKLYETTQTPEIKNEIDRIVTQIKNVKTEYLEEQMNLEKDINNLEIILKALKEEEEEENKIEFDEEEFNRKDEKIKKKEEEEEEEYYSDKSEDVDESDEEEDKPQNNDSDESEDKEELKSQIEEERLFLKNKLKEYNKKIKKNPNDEKKYEKEIDKIKIKLKNYKSVLEKLEKEENEEEEPEISLEEKIRKELEEKLRKEIEEKTRKEYEERYKKEVEERLQNELKREREEKKEEKAIKKPKPSQGEIIQDFYNNSKTKHDHNVIEIMGNSILTLDINSGDKVDLINYQYSPHNRHLTLNITKDVKLIPNKTVFDEVKYINIKNYIITQHTIDFLFEFKRIDRLRVIDCYFDDLKIKNQLKVKDLYFERTNLGLMVLFNSKLLEKLEIDECSGECPKLILNSIRVIKIFKTKSFIPLEIHSKRVEECSLIDVNPMTAKNLFQNYSLDKIDSKTLYLSE
jgi:hypothetical protein